MFQLTTITECELTSFVGRTQREGKDDIPAVSFRLALAGVSNTMLDMFSKTLREAIYCAVEGQEQLPGVEASTPLLRSKDVTHLAPEFRYEGWKVWVARGLDDDALHMERVKVDDFKFTFFEGGKMDFDFRLSTADVDEEGAGMLWGRQKRKVFVRIEAPELPAQGEKTEATGADIDGTKGHPGAAEGQGSLLDDEAAPQTPEGALAASLAGDGQASKGALDATGNNPFGRSADPGDDQAGEADEGSSTDAGAGNAAEFEAGAAQAISKARGSRRAAKAH